MIWARMWKGWKWHLRNDERTQRALCGARPGLGGASGMWDGKRALVDWPYAGPNGKYHCSKCITAGADVEIGRRAANGRQLTVADVVGR